MSQLTAASVKDARTPLRKHLDGWQIGVLAIVIAWGSALVIVPRSAAPEAIPLPAVAPANRTAILRRDGALAARAKSRPLELAVRKLGADLRSLGRAEAAEGTSPSYLLDRARADAVEAVAKSPDQVLELRAYQTDLFAKALYAWAATGKSSADLVELGGSIIALLPSIGWVRSERGRTRITIDELALRAVFKKRWDAIAGFEGPAFALDLDEERAKAAFAITRAWRQLEDAAATGEMEAGSPRTQSLVEHIEELGRVDPSYPTRFAIGVVRLKSTEYVAALDAFSRYLTTSPDGPYAVRARNYMKAALGGAEAQGM